MVFYNDKGSGQEIRPVCLQAQIFCFITDKVLNGEEKWTNAARGWQVILGCLSGKYKSVFILQDLIDAPYLKMENAVNQEYHPNTTEYQKDEQEGHKQSGYEHYKKR